MNYLEKYNYLPSGTDIERNLRSIAADIEAKKTSDVLHKCFSIMDLTTLHSNDTVDDVKKLVGKVNGLKSAYPALPLPASVCVFSNFASVVRDTREDSGLHVTSVSACFPTSQSFPEVKALECRMAVRDGADEIDVVLNLGLFFSGDYAAVSNEIRMIRDAIDKEAAAMGHKVVLKVILETGLLVTPENIATASFIAMESGADFIKTSTGKVSVNATPAAALIMCHCISRFYSQTGIRVGFKAAGGISTAADAVAYYLIVESVLGKEWLDKKYFRFGVSNLGNALMSEIEGGSVKYF